MSFVDWSDPEELFGLLVEYVADERSEADDADRRAFLSRLRKQLQDLQPVFETGPLVEATNALRAIHGSIGVEFEADPVVEHLSACVEELERVRQTLSA